MSKAKLSQPGRPKLENSKTVPDAAEKEAPDKSRKALVRCHTLLVNNIILGDGFYAKMRQSHVLPESMIREIQNCKSQEEGNNRLVELLLVRGSVAVERFCDALQTSGHCFLADTLRDELLEEEERCSLGADEICAKFPELNKHLARGEKEQLEKVMNEKISEMVVRTSWLKVSNDKEKWMDARQVQIEQNHRYQEEVKDKDATINKMQEQMNQMKKELTTRNIQMGQMSQQLRQSQEGHKEDMVSNNRFNEANDRSLHRMTERHLHTEKTLMDMTSQMEHYVRATPKKDIGRKQRRRSSTLEGIMDIFREDASLEKVRQMQQVLLQEMEELRVIEKKHNTFRDERRQMLAHIGASDDNDLHIVFKKFVVEKEELVAKLQSDIDELKMELGKQNEFNKQMDLVEDLRADTNELRNRLSETEQTIVLLTTENEKLKYALRSSHHRRNSMGKQPSLRSRPSTPTFQNYGKEENGGRTNTVTFDTSVHRLNKNITKDATDFRIDTTKTAARENNETPSLPLIPLSTSPAHKHSARLAMRTPKSQNGPILRFNRKPNELSSSYGRNGTTRFHGKKDEMNTQSMLNPLQINTFQKHSLSSSMVGLSDAYSKQHTLDISRRSYQGMR